MEARGLNRGVAGGLAKNPKFLKSKSKNQNKIFKIALEHSVACLQVKIWKDKLEVDDVGAGQVAGGERGQVVGLAQRQQRVSVIHLHQRTYHS